MSRKRTLLPDIYKTKKKVCPSGNNTTQDDSGFEEGPSITCTVISLPSDTKAFLLYLRNLFPIEKFEHRLPPIMLKHQLYSLINNRTMVDKQLNDLKVSGEVKLFKLGNETDEYGVVFTDDYRTHVSRVMAEVSIERNVTERFVNTVINHCHDLSINKDTLMVEYLFKDEEITQLVKASVLTVRDIGSWWITVPNAGMYVKSFQRGRKALLTMIRKCKYKEILRKDLEQRKWPKMCRLGLLYHVHDIIGADLVECIQTTSGQLIRLKE